MNMKQAILSTTKSLMAALLTLGLLILDGSHILIAGTSHDQIEEIKKTFGPSDKQLNRFDSFIYHLEEICKKHCGAAEIIDDIANKVEEGFKVLNGEAFLFDQSVIDAINADATRLEKLSGKPPAFELLTPELINAINSNDPEKVRVAYEAIEASRIEYISKLQRWKQKREVARLISDDAESAYHRVLRTEQALSTILRSFSAPLLQAVYRFDLLLLDVKVPLSEAIIKRAAAAYELKQSYDRAIGEMTANVRRTEGLQQWIDFVQFQEAFRGDVPVSGGDLNSLLNKPIGGADKLQVAKNIVNSIKQSNLRSEQSLKIGQALKQMQISNEIVRKEADRLWRAAAAADKEKAKAEMTTGILQSGVAIAGAFAKSGGEASSFSSSQGAGQGVDYYFQFEYTEMMADGLGNIYFNSLRFEGGTSTNNPTVINPLQ